MNVNKNNGGENKEIDGKQRYKQEIMRDKKVRKIAKTKKKKKTILAGSKILKKTENTKINTVIGKSMVEVGKKKCKKEKKRERG